jgi:uncharacterized membrane protein
MIRITTTTGAPMKLFTDHRLTIAAGFVLAAILIGAGIAKSGTVPDVYDLARWGHFLAGITWVGLLYYFNFVQAPAMASFSPETKAELFQEGGLARRALWWFRWAAMFTLIFGGILYMHLAKTGAEGVDIRIGATLAIIMWFNVWFVIWPAQKRVLGIVAAEAETKAAAGRRALIASRTNVLLSIPMLFFMASSSHFPIFG